MIIVKESTSITGAVFVTKRVHLGADTMCEGCKWEANYNL